MTHPTDQFSYNNIMTHQTDRSKYVGTLYAVIAGLSFLLISIISFLICHPPLRKEIRRLFSSSSPYSNQHSQDEIESNSDSSTNKLSRELKSIQTDQATLMNPFTETLPTLSLNSTINQSSIHSESLISPLTIHSPLKTPLPIKTQITQPALAQTKDHHSIPNLRHPPHTISPILKNSQSHYNHLRSSSSNHELKSIHQDYFTSNQMDSSYLSASLPPINNRQRYSLYDFNRHSNDLIHDHQVRSKSTPLDLDPNHECYCVPFNRNSASTFIASPITLEEGEEIRLSQTVLISNQDLYPSNSCQVFPARSDSHSIDHHQHQLEPNSIDHLVMRHKDQISDSIENDNVSLESNEFYRGRTKSRPTTIIHS